MAGRATAQCAAVIAAGVLLGIAPPAQADDANVADLAALQAIATLKRFTSAATIFWKGQVTMVS